MSYLVTFKLVSTEVTSSRIINLHWTATDFMKNMIPWVAWTFGVDAFVVVDGDNDIPIGTVVRLRDLIPEENILTRAFYIKPISHQSFLQRTILPIMMGDIIGMDYPELGRGGPIQNEENENEENENEENEENENEENENEENEENEANNVNSRNYISGRQGHGQY